MTQRIRCIECEEIELARVHDQPPSQTLPVPYAALDGFPAGRTPRDLSRRRLLQFGVAGVASVYGSKVLGWDSIWESVAAEAAAPATNNCLVLLYLAGGNDGLNVILPNETNDYNAYAAARAVIHREKGPTTVDRVGSTALNGAAGDVLRFSNVVVSTPGGGDNADANFGFDTLYGPGTGGTNSDLAIMPAVDATNYSLSHFDNSDLWFNGNPGGLVSTGWLGRWIDRNGSDTNPLQAISIDTALSKSIRTASKPVCAIPSLSALGFTMNGSGYASPSGTASSVDVNAQMRALATVPVGAGNAYLGRSRSTYGVAVESYDISKAGPPYVAGAGYPNTGTLSTRLRLAAHLLSANLGTRIITIHWGSFDTHSGQLTAQDGQLKELSRALGAFKADLAARGIENRVSTLVFSEFGRRVAENGSAGTDHGAGGLMMAMGSGVRGGLAAEWPGCETTEQTGGNLKVPTDFRSVYRSVIEEWLGDDYQAVLGGGTIKQLVRGDGLTGRTLFK
jgi:uncharacterized protein (DUF1501 family)